MSTDVITRAKARGLSELLKDTPVVDLATGDQFVKPGYMQVYGVDSDGYASLSAQHAGTRFEVIDNERGVLKARVVRREGIDATDEDVRSQKIPEGAKVLKVFSI